MKISLKFEDFQLDEIQETKVKGGKEGDPTISSCTEGDHGCCDESHVDDEELRSNVQ